MVISRALQVLSGECGWDRGGKTVSRDGSEGGGGESSGFVSGEAGGVLWKHCGDEEGVRVLKMSIGMGVVTRAIGAA